MQRLLAASVGDSLAPVELSARAVAVKLVRTGVSVFLADSEEGEGVGGRWGGGGGGTALAGWLWGVCVGRLVSIIDQPGT